MADDKEDRLAQLRQAYERSVLDEDTYRAAFAAVDADSEAPAVMSGSRAVAIGLGAVAVGGSGVVISGSVHGGLIVTGENNVVKDATDLPRLPAECPSCGAPVRPGEVEWLSETAAACSHCGSILQARRES